MQNNFLTVGELARKMGTTVRTLQYYDKEGLLKPSSISEGGRRLYTSKDIIKLHQILSFKYLGFSLEEIKNKLLPLDDPEEVSRALERQKAAVREQMNGLGRALQAIDELQKEIISIKEVDFSKYAEIIELLKTGNEGYWAWKCFDTPLKDHVRTRFGDDGEKAIKIFQTYKEVLEESVILKRNGESPESEKSIRTAQKWWDMVLEFTGGDMSLLPELEAFNEKKENWDNDLADKQKEVDDFLTAALNSYFAEQERK